MLSLDHDNPVHFLERRGLNGRVLVFVRPEINTFSHDTRVGIKVRSGRLRGIPGINGGARGDEPVIACFPVEKPGIHRQVDLRKGQKGGVVSRRIPENVTRCKRSTACKKHGGGVNDPPGHDAVF